MSSTSTLALANNSTVNLLADTSGTFTPATISLPSSGNTAININVGALTTASNNAVTLSGALTYAGGGTALTNSLNVTASNGYTFNLGVLNLPSSANNFAFGLNVSAGSVMNTGTVEFGSYGQNFTVGGYGVVNITSLGFGSNSTSNFIVGNGTSEPTVTLLSPDYSFNNRAGGNFYVIVNSGTLNLNAYGDVANPSSSSTPTATLNSGGTLNLNIAGDLSGIGPLIINGGTLNNMGASANTGASESTNQLNGDFAWSGSNSLTLNGAATLGGSGSSIRTITTSGTGILVFANAISTTGSGPTQIDLAGTGAIQLNGADTFTGGITLNGPQLYIDNATALGGGGLTVNSGTFGNNSSTVSLTDTASQTWNGSNIAFDGPNSLTTGTVTLNASPSLTVTAGTLTVPSVTGPGLSITLASGGGALALTGSNNIASVTMSGGILIDTNSNALGSGTFTINGGTLDNTASTATAIANPIQINGDFGYRGTHSITLSGSAALSGSNRTITTAGSGTLTLTGVISGSSQLTEAGTGYLALNGTNTYSGGTVINATLSVGNGSSENVSALGSGTVAINTGGELIFNPGGTSTTYDTANSIVLNGGVLNGGDGVQHIGTGVGATINVTAAGGTLGSQYNGKSLYLDGQLTGSGPLTVENFQQTYSSNSVTHITNNSNTYSGVITLDATAVMGEQIEVDAADALQYATVNLVGTEGSASGLLWNSSAPVLGAIEGNGNFQLETNSSGGVALTVGGNNASTTYSGVISTGTGGVGSLTKTGAGTMILSGSSTYTGLTTVSQGALIVTGSISGAVSDSGTFGGSGAVGGLVTVNQNGVLEPGALETTAAGAQLTLQSGLTLAGTSTLVINLDSSDNIDSLAITGNLTLGADDTLTLNLLSGANLDQPSYTIATVTGGIISGSFANTNLPENYQVETVGNSLELVAVPEPGTIGIVLGGFAMLIGMQRCRRTRVKS
jgi:autotransporter-associated beta strand protein